MLAIQRSDVVLLVIVSCLCSVVKCDRYRDVEVDCGQFADDIDIVRRLPFPVLIDPYYGSVGKSTVWLHDNTSFVREIQISNEKFVPPSVFCFSRLEILRIFKTPFLNDVIPDALGNLQRLSSFDVFDTTVKKITERLTTLPDLALLTFDNCSLTSLPNLSNLKQLSYLGVSFNGISHIEGIPNVTALILTGNRFTHIPRTPNPDRLEFIDMSHNPLGSIESMMMYPNVKDMYMINTSITSIPAAIDKFSKLKYLRLSHNKITHLPESILNLRRLKELDVSNNSLSMNDIASFRKAFKKSHPRLKALF